MHAVFALLPLDVRASLPWKRDKLNSIELPAGSEVPPGALQTASVFRLELWSPSR